MRTIGRRTGGGISLCRGGLDHRVLSPPICCLPGGGRGNAVGMCFWGATYARLRIRFVPRADQSNTWFLLPMWTSQHLPGWAAASAADARPEQLVLRERSVG